MKHATVVFGTRPEAIKLCPLVRELMRRKANFRTTVVVSAQHREMLDQVLDIFEVTPDFDLDLMRSNQSLTYMTSRCLSEMSEIFEKTTPDVLIVQGDTTTTLAASLAAFYHRVPVAHVEAGLRTDNKYSPFPEEINRRLTSTLSDIHFAPTIVNRDNLLREGVPPEKIRVTGNTVIDALLSTRERIRDRAKSMERELALNTSRRIILVTGHRRENFGLRFNQIFEAFRQLAVENPDVDIIYPVHLNPNVRKPVNKILAGIKNVRLIEPLDYEKFVFLMDRAFFIISDSGGIQEEAPSLGKPVLVTRDNTERPEAVAAGTVKLVGADTDRIVSESRRLLHDAEYYAQMANATNPYGDGHACEIIADAITIFLDEQSGE